MLVALKPFCDGRIEEVKDMSMVPPKGEPALSILSRDERIVPRAAGLADTAFLVSATMLRSCHL